MHIIKCKWGISVERVSESWDRWIIVQLFGPCFDKCIAILRPLKNLANPEEKKEKINITKTTDKWKMLHYCEARRVNHLNLFMTNNSIKTERYWTFVQGNVKCDIKYL